MAGGHFCNKAEQNYSPIEGEATAVARGLHDTKYYTMGCKHLYVATDHKSLVCVLSDQALADVENPRLARIKESSPWSTPQASSSSRQMHYREGRPNSLQQSTDLEAIEKMMMAMKLLMT